MGELAKQNQANKKAVWEFWQRLNHAPADQMDDLVRAAFHSDIEWHGCHPLNHIQGTDTLISDFWQPLRHAFPDLKRQVDVFFGGVSGDEQWVSGMGYLTGTFAKNWLGIPATGAKANLRFGQFYLMRAGKIAESYVIFDLLDLMRQAGFQILPPSKGLDGGKVPGPTTRDGVLLSEQDPLTTRQTAQLVEAMALGLRRYNRARDGGDMSSMEQHHYWQPDMHWFGPSGIGSTLTLEEFADFHQRPWLHAFGDRGLYFDGGRTIGLKDGDILAEGNYAALGIWDAPFSHHNGSFHGVPPTGQLMTMRDFDWYRREGQLIAQNWVPIDLIDLFLQMGIDIFEILKEKVARQKEGHTWFNTK